MSNRREGRRAGGKGGLSSRVLYLLGGGVLIVAAAVVVIAVAALGRGSEAPTEAGPGVDDGAVTGAVATGTNTPGPKTALVTLEEFGDFQCSHCVDFASRGWAGR